MLNIISIHPLVWKEENMVCNRQSTVCDFIEKYMENNTRKRNRDSKEESNLPNKKCFHPLYMGTIICNKSRKQRILDCLGQHDWTLYWHLKDVDDKLLDKIISIMNIVQQDALDKCVYNDAFIKTSNVLVHHKNVTFKR